MGSFLFLRLRKFGARGKAFITIELSKVKVNAPRSPGQSSKAGKQEASGWARSERKWIAPAIPVREEDTKCLVSEHLLDRTTDQTCVMTD